MEVTQTLAEGLKHEFRVVLPVEELAAKLEAQLSELRSKAQIKGFRPGKAPSSYLKKIYGKGIMSEVLQEAVNEANRKIVEDHGLRVALEPKLDLPVDQTLIEKALEAEGDFAYSVAFEVLPKFEVGGFDDISIERPVAEVKDEDVAKSIDQLAERIREFEEKAGEGVTAAKGDRVTIDFTGKLDGEAFEGGGGDAIDLVLGSGSFIPGFEEQLEGAGVGEQRVVKVKFPDDYSAPNLAGKDAEFDVTVKAVAAPKELPIDDAFAAKYNFETLAALQAAVRANLEADYEKASRAKLKRSLLDALDKRFSFDLPEGLVEQEFTTIWGQLDAERQRSGKSFEDEGTTEEAARGEYRRIAERRVRLGLVLAEIGQGAGVTVEDKDVTDALVERVRMFPGREKEVWDFYRNNPQALAQIRAPLYEERVVDHLVTKIGVTDKPVTREELMAEDEDDELARPAV
ncbi:MULTISPECIES: trigger factor [Methylosinus]|uniref:Trigger factor n=1 Tax=Methylosinus trichosporium (strain ATCC 35070 / NCIMB 11131 / UNIQEM 75 / OB3b) TaxID=595536 RepID=A0A2D2D506_METT3|nr:MULTISPECIES: trigger factor [Methylosinus]ATQ70056.1 trigger factor [Methylosinus trichosporium OB3b]OBS54409.1 trigger factor [Methylosinus sp. 3S-1]